MDIQTFQLRLAQLCEQANNSNRLLKGNQVREFFDGMELDREQLLQIFQYLKSQGIEIEGITFSEEHHDGENHMTQEEKEAAQAEAVQKKIEENACLTKEDREYLKKYKESLTTESAGQDEKLMQFLPAAADLAAEYYRDGMHFMDLIQEANVCLLTILAEENLTDQEIQARLRKGVKQAADDQDEQKFEDDCLVAKVQNLDSVMKELTDEDGGEPKFSVEELAIMLDMDIDEMKDIIRLTGSM